MLRRGRAHDGRRGRAALPRGLRSVAFDGLCSPRLVTLSREAGGERGRDRGDLPREIRTPTSPARCAPGFRGSAPIRAGSAARCAAGWWSPPTAGPRSPRPTRGLPRRRGGGGRGRAQGAARGVRGRGLGLRGFQLPVARRRADSLEVQERASARPTATYATCPRRSSGCMNELAPAKVCGAAPGTPTRAPHRTRQSRSASTRRRNSKARSWARPASSVRPIRSSPPTLARDGEVGRAIVVVAGGEGAEALLFAASEARGARRPPPSARRDLAPAAAADLRELSQAPPPGLPARVAGRAGLERDRVAGAPAGRALYGTRCFGCGMVQYPKARVCFSCTQREQREPIKLTKNGPIFTFTIDHLAAYRDHPMPMAVVDLEGGGRVYVQMTDAPPKKSRSAPPSSSPFAASTRPAKTRTTSGRPARYDLAGRGGGEGAGGGGGWGGGGGEEEGGSGGIGPGRRHRRRLHEVRRALRPTYEDLVCDAAFQPTTTPRSTRARSTRPTSARTCRTPRAGRRGSRSATRSVSTTGPVTRVENFCATGTDAFRNACLAIASGRTTSSWWSARRN